MYDILYSLSRCEAFQDAFGSGTLKYMLGLGSNVIAVFSVIFLFYTSSFLIKQRQQEFGLYSVLGMGKRHIAKILFYETLFVAIISLALGLLIGSLLNWAAFLALANMVSLDPHSAFSLDFGAMERTCVLFLGIFLLIFLYSALRIQLLSTISLVKSGQEGEREPRSKWILAVLGLILLGTGYGLSLYIQNPMGAFLLFFVAVILVILGTYCLFTAGSIVFLKLLRKNKRYYYKTGHFISVSGMLYRMKQNAVSLGNICILSTMVLVTVSSTMSLYVGSDSLLKSRYPRELNLTMWSDSMTSETNQTATELLHDMIAQQGLTASGEVSLTYLTMAATQNGSTLQSSVYDDSLLAELTSVVGVSIVSLSSYNRLANTARTLNADEMLVYCSESYPYDTLNLFDQDYQVAELDAFPCEDIVSDASFKCFIAVVSDETFESIWAQQQSADTGSGTYCIYTYVGCDIGDDDVANDIASTFRTTLNNILDNQATADTYSIWSCSIYSRADMREDFLQLYGALFFVGIFLGLLFLIATILIIYYKQLSEGMADKKRYAIMQKVGLTQQEIRSSIHAQILTMFFLPLLTAFLHTAFAFPMIARCLKVLSMTDTTGFIQSLLLCCGIFALVYGIVYLVTSKVYYNIVGNPD
jgi:putative ABC transport system permease protein